MSRIWRLICAWRGWHSFRDEVYRLTPHGHAHIRHVCRCGVVR